MSIHHHINCNSQGQKRIVPCQVSQYHRQKSIQEDVLGEGEGGETKKATGGESGATYHHVLSTYY